jgi:MFS family permease
MINVTHGNQSVFIVLLATDLFKCFFQTKDLRMGIYWEAPRRRLPVYFPNWTLFVLKEMPDASKPSNGIASCLDPSKSSFRYTLLALNCLLTFGSYYCFDMPTVLESMIESQVVAKFTDSVSTYYNLFYTIYAWTNMCMSLIAGVIIDRYGTKFSSFLFITLCLVGASLFALGATLTSASGMTRYILMFIGRFIFGLGGGSITIVQNAITARWFTGRELAFAFGCTLTISRIGSVVNYDATSLIYDGTEAAYPGYGLGITLWIGASLILFSYFAAAGIVVMDNKKEAYDALHNEEEIDDNLVADFDFDADGVLASASGKPQPAATETSQTSFTSYLEDLKQMPMTFWTVCLIITFFYNLVFPWQAIAVDYIRTSYGVHDNEWASWRASMVYMVSMIVSPFMGAAVDWYGRRDWLTILGTGMSIPVFIMLSDSDIEPVIPLLLLGVCYSVCAAALWPTLQILVNPKTVGRANGVATSMQMLGIGICNIIVGSLKDNNKGSNSQSPSCCFEDGNSEACFDTAYTGTCQPAEYGRCSNVEVDGVDYNNNCQVINYQPMLNFFTAMACCALLFAISLKVQDAKEYDLFIGIKDQNIAYKERYGIEPDGKEEMKEARRLVKSQLRGEDVLIQSSKEPLLDNAE